MNLKKLGLAAVGLLAVGTLAACGKSDTDSVAHIQKQKQIVLAVSPDYPPFEYSRLQNGKNEIVGIDIDLAKAIAKKLDVKLKVNTMDFDNVLTTLSQGKADLGISGISVTNDRKNAFTFSNTYYIATNEVVVKKSDLNKYKSMDDFKGLNLAAQKGSTQETCVKTQLTGAKLISLPGVGEEVNEVKSGQVAGAVMEDMIAKSYVSENPDLAVAKVKIPNPKSNLGMAVAMQKGSTSLQTKVNQVIKELKASGQLDKIIQDNYKASQAAKK